MHELAGELARRGVPSRQDGRALLVRLDGDAIYDLVRDVIAEQGLPLNRLEQRRRRVEELFRDEAPEGQAAEVAHER